MSLPVVVIACFLFLFNPPSATDIKTNANIKVDSPADLKVTTRYLHGGRSIDFIEYFSGNLSRREGGPFSGERSAHRRAVITQRGTDQARVFDLDLDAHEYVVYMTNLTGMSVTAPTRVLKTKLSGPKVEMFSDSVDTGETKEIFGHVAHHIITKERRVAGPGACASNSENEIDGWYIDYEALPAWRRPRPDASMHVIAFTCGNAFDRYEFHRSGPLPGYPVKTTTVTHAHTTLPDGTTKESVSTSGVEVLEFWHAPLDRALFQVPPDFRVVRRLADQRPQTLWQWLKDTWDDLFD